MRGASLSAESAAKSCADAAEKREKNKSGGCKAGRRESYCVLRRTLKNSEGFKKDGERLHASPGELISLKSIEGNTSGVDSSERTFIRLMGSCKESSEAQMALPILRIPSPDFLVIQSIEDLHIDNLLRVRVFPDNSYELNGCSYFKSARVSLSDRAVSEALPESSLLIVQFIKMRPLQKQGLLKTAEFAALTGRLGEWPQQSWLAEKPGVYEIAHTEIVQVVPKIRVEEWLFQNEVVLFVRRTDAHEFALFIDGVEFIKTERNYERLEIVKRCACEGNIGNMQAETLTDSNVEFSIEMYQIPGCPLEITITSPYFYLSWKLN